MIDDWNREWGPASGRPQEGATRMRGNDLWRAAATYSRFEEFVLRGTEELPPARAAAGALPARPRAGVVRRLRRRTETFAEDLAEVERRLGGDPTPVPHRNRSPHGSYRDYYTPATRDRVAEVYADDLEAFGYTF